MKSTDFRFTAELGAVIDEAVYQHIESSWYAAAWLFFGVFFGLCMWFGHEAPLEGIAIVSLAVGLGGILAVGRKLTGRTGDKILRVHENGLQFLHLDKTTNLPYRNLKECSFKKTMICSESVHLYDLFELDISAYVEGNLKTIQWNCRTAAPFASSDQKAINFDALHLQISERVADNMAVMLEENQKVPWGRSAFIHANGIEAKVKTGGFSSQVQLTPLSKLRDITFRNGKLIVSFHSENSSITIPCSEPNVLAGVLLVDRLMKNTDVDLAYSRQTEGEIVTAIAKRFIVHSNGSP